MTTANTQQTQTAGKDAQAQKGSPAGLDQLNTQTGSFLPAFRTFDEVYRWCALVASSGMVPKAYKDKPADVLVAVQFGAEIGLKWLQSLQSIAVVNGTPSIYGDAGLALVRASGLLEEFDEWIEVAGQRVAGSADVIKLDEQGHAVVAYCRSKRRGSTSRTTAFSAADAKQMKLWLKKKTYYDGGRQVEIESPWCTVPQRMLMWRARGWNLRDNFGDVLKGMPIYEEAIDLDTYEPKSTAEVIAAQSQPGTKGEALTPALDRVAEERAVPLQPQPAPAQDQPGSTPASEPAQELPEQAPREDTAAQGDQEDPLLTAIEAGEAVLRGSAAGQKALGQIWGAFKVRLVGQQRPVDVLPAEQRPLYLRELSKAVAAVSKKTT